MNYTRLNLNRKEGNTKTVDNLKFEGRVFMQEMYIGGAIAVLIMLIIALLFRS